MLVAVANQDVEVGVDHRLLVPAGDLEGLGANTVHLVGLGLQIWMLRRVDDLQVHPVPGRDLVLAQHVPDLGDERRQQWVRPLTEVTAHQQGLLQAAQQIPSRLRKRILSAVRQIKPERLSAQREDPDVGKHQIHHHEN